MTRPSGFVLDSPLEQMIIGGELRGSNVRHEVVDPYRDEVVATVHHGDESSVSAAIRSAQEGHQQVAALSLYQRIECFERAAELIATNGRHLAETISRQTGKAIKESRVEIIRSQRTIRAAISAARELRGDVVGTDSVPDGEGMLAFTRREPLGVVAAITPFNSPFNIPMHKVASALITGNSIILKPALQAPISGLQLGTILIEAGFPAAAINVLPGGAETGAALAQSPAIDAISFTGGVAGGNAVAMAAGAKPTVLELGGNSANIVCRDADLQRSASHLVKGAYSNAGQTCNSVQRVIVDRSVASELAAELAIVSNRLVVGDPLDESSDIGTLINEEAAKRIEQWVNEAVANGAEPMSPLRRTGASLTPVVLHNVDPSMRIACEEVFGPVMVVIPAASLEESIEIANETPFGLQASVFTASLGNALRAASQLKAGGVMINRSSKTRLDHLPFGGVKASGFGKEGGAYSLSAFTYQKLILIDPGLSAGLGSTQT